MLGLVGLFGWVSCNVKGRRGNHEEDESSLDQIHAHEKDLAKARRPQLEAELRNKSTAEDRMLEQFSRIGITEE